MMSVHPQYQSRFECPGVEFQCTSGCGARLPFLSTVQTVIFILWGSIPTSSPLFFLFSSLTVSVSVRCVRGMLEVTGPLAVITNPLCFYYRWEALKVFISPSLLYWGDEQTGTFKDGRRACRGAKSPTAHLSANKVQLQMKLPWWQQ